MQKLSLTKRPAKIGAGIPSRTERHGDDEVGAMTIPVKDITLFPQDINVMFNDGDAHARLFIKAGTPDASPSLGGALLYIQEKFKGAKVTIKADTMTEALILKPATVENIWLTREESAGLVKMTCTIKGAPADDTVVNILRMLNRKCSIAILNGSIVTKTVKDEEDEKQGALDLSADPPTSDEDDPEGEAAVARQSKIEVGTGNDTVSSTGRKIQRAARKKGKKD